MGVTNFGYLPLLTTVDRVIGVDTTFTENIVIDTSFISGSYSEIKKTRFIKIEFMYNQKLYKIFLTGLVVLCTANAVMRQLISVLRIV